MSGGMFGGKFTIDSAKIKKLVLLNMPYGIIFVIILQVIPRLPPALTDLIPVAIPNFVIALVVAALIRVVVYFKGRNAKKYRKDIEYGSARWSA
jgi:hypothetical protein